MSDIASNLIKIADASRRADGTDIPLGKQVRAAAARIEALETFVCSIAWGPPHIIEYNTYINSLVDKAQRLCPKNDKKEKPSNVVSFDRI